VLKYLIEMGADFELPQTESGVTPLIVAAEYNKFEALKVLMDAGANIHTKENVNIISLSHE
jgi:ankyrin repeat protein